MEKILTFPIIIAIFMIGFYATFRTQQFIKKFDALTKKQDASRKLRESLTGANDSFWIKVGGILGMIYGILMALFILLN